MRAVEAGYYPADRQQRMLRERIERRWMDAYAPVRHLDPVLVLTALALSAVGIVMIYSATFHRLEVQGAEPTLIASRQLMNLAAATLAMIAAAAVDYRYIRAYAPVIYAGTLGLLLLVLSPLGVEVKGAQRWVEFGAFQLQPAELAKVAVLVAVAAVLHERKGDPNALTVLASLALVAAPVMLIFLQPDLGTLIVFVWLGFVLLLVGNVKARYLFALGVLSFGGVAAVIRLGLLEGYQLARLTAFLEPSSDTLARTIQYNTNQSLIAIGSGGFTGKGYLQGTQTSLAYVPENHTDFIFTVVGEEFGFVGSVLILGLFALLMWRGLRIAAMAKDLFGTLLAVGAVSIIGLQVFVNVGMTIGIMPVTGIPLPFVSYGGTSLLAGFVLVGLMLNVHMRRF